MEKISKKYIKIIPSDNIKPEKQLRNCLQKLKDKIKSEKLSDKNVIKQTIFLKADNNEDYYQKIINFSSEINNFYKHAPPTSFIAQAPGNNKVVALEVILSTASSENITYKLLNGIKYTVINFPKYKEIYAAGLTADNKKDNILKQSKYIFKLMENILEKEDLTFSDVVRQWNYIENILEINPDVKGRQNYQIFNDIRGINYAKSNFQNGYPASTGIGMTAGGIVIDFIAIKKYPKIQIMPAQNSRQVDAYNYSDEFLIGKPISEVSKKNSPKFERGKLVNFDGSIQIFISGTAAIIGQNVVGKKDIEKQTLETIKNILSIISKKNLKKLGQTTKLKLNNLSYIRVYIKNEANIPKVKRICEKFFVNVPCFYVVADICRNELLVEIEGIIDLPNQKS